MLRAQRPVSSLVIRGELWRCLCRVRRTQSGGSTRRAETEGGSLGTSGGTDWSVPSVRRMSKLTGQRHNPWSQRSSLFVIGVSWNLVKSHVVSGRLPCGSLHLRRELACGRRQAGIFLINIQVHEFMKCQVSLFWWKPPFIDVDGNHTVQNIRIHPLYIISIACFAVTWAIW